LSELRVAIAALFVVLSVFKIPTAVWSASTVTCMALILFATLSIPGKEMPSPEKEAVISPVQLFLITMEE
jgi:hypothetical protein